MLTDAPQWEREGRDWPNRAHSRFVEADRLRWHVQVAGPGAQSAPVILLLHGTGAATHSWRALLPLLSAGCRVIAPDLPGHGFTRGRPAGGMSMEAMAAAVAALLAVLGETPGTIVGHSAGAAIAARLVLDGHATPGCLIGLNAALLPFPGLASKIFPTLARMLFVNPFMPHVFAAIARQSGEPKRFLERSTGSVVDTQGADYYGRLFATAGHCAGAISMMADWDLEVLARDLPRLNVPLELVHGAGDAAIPVSAAKGAAALVPGSRVRVLPGLGHLAHEEAPDALAAIVLSGALARAG